MIAVPIIGIWITVALFVAIYTIEEAWGSTELSHRDWFKILFWPIALGIWLVKVATKGLFDFTFGE